MAVHRLIRHCLLAFALVAGLVAITPSEAQAVGTGSLTGKVRDADGPASGVAVSAYLFEGDEEYTWVGATTSAPDGSYTVGELEPGSYFLEYSDDDGEHQTTYSNGKVDTPSSPSSPGVYDVATGPVNVADITVSFAPNSELTGRTETAGGTKIDNVLVQAFPAGAPVDSDPIASDISYGGEYSLWVPPGEHRLEFSHLGGDYADALKDATAVRDETVTLDTTVLEPAANFVTVSGKVNFPSIVTADEVQVRIYRFTTTPDRSDFDYSAVGTVPVNAAGSFTFDRAVPGKRYSVEVSGERLHDRWLGNATDAEEADSFLAAAGQVLSAITVPVRPTISGRVTDSTGNASGVRVGAWQWNEDFGWDEVADTTTAADGTYRVAVEGPGRYALNFDPSESSSPGREVWLNGSTSWPEDSGDAGSFVVADTAQLTGKNILLPNATRVTGTVTSAGAPVEEVEVTAFVPAGDGGWEPTDSVSTDASGNYLLRLSQTGPYTLRYETPLKSPAASKWLGGLDQAPNGNGTGPGTFTLAPGTVTDRDIDLPVAPKGSGRILSSDGGPVAGATVRSYVWEEDYWEWYGVGVTDSQGNYAVKVVGSGNATIRAAAAGHYRSWLGGTATRPGEPTGTNSVALTGSDVTVPDTTLTAVPKTRGSIEGIISAASDGSPVNHATVIACPALGGRCEDTETDSSGSYGFTDVVTGDWRLRVWPPDENLYADGGKVTVTKNTTVTADFALGAPAPVPGGVAVAQGGQVTSSGVPSVVTGAPLTLTAPGPQVSPAPRYTVRLASGEVLHQGSMTWNGTKYTVTIPELERSGEAVVSITGLAAGPVRFDLYIDPSGVVVDQFGVPLSGSEATLLRSDTEGGAYAAVPNGSDTMSPGNRVNPMPTGSDARFHWDVLEGWYKVRAEHDNCDTGSTQAMQVAPVRVDLMVQLTCAERDPNSTKPAITGTSKVGEQLTATSGSWAAQLTQKSYQWYSGSEPVAGATGGTYTVRSADVGKAITVRETARRPDYVTENGTGATVTFTAATATSSAVTGTSGPAPTNTALPKITGTRKSGSTLTTTAGSWNLPGLTYAYQWRRNGAVIAGATKSTYKLVAADAARSITVGVTATKAGHGSKSATAAAVTIAKLASTTSSKLVASKIRVSKRGQVTVTVRATGLTPTGKVTVLINGRARASGTLKKGTVKVTLPKVGKGVHRVHSSYAGATQIASSKSGVAKLTVVK